MMIDLIQMKVHYWGGYQAKRPQGLEGKITCPIVYWRAFFILFHHFCTHKLVYMCYFLRITVSRPVGHVFILLAHLKLKYHLNFMNNCKHVKKYVLLHCLISFPKSYED